MVSQIPSKRPRCCATRSNGVLSSHTSHLRNTDERRYRNPRLMSFLTERGIPLYNKPCSVFRQRCAKPKSAVLERVCPMTKHAWFRWRRGHHFRGYLLYATWTRNGCRVYLASMLRLQDYCLSLWNTRFVCCSDHPCDLAAGSLLVTLRFVRLCCFRDQLVIGCRRFYLQSFSGVT